MHTPPRLIPTLRYANAPAALDWLCKAFGFERHAVYAGEGEIIHHAQLTYAGGMIMISSWQDNAFGKLLKLPAHVGGTGTQCTYVIVPDADAHHARAVAAGAKVVYPLQDEDYGGRGYACVDLEGHLWSFGTYDPWAPEAR